MKTHLTLLAALAAAGTASATVYFEDFSYPDGTTAGFAGGAALASNVEASAQVIGGRLRVTQNTTSNNAAFHVPAFPDSANGFVITFDYEINEPAGGNPPADGFSFSYGDVPFAGLSGQAEEAVWGGSSSILSWEVDTWMNGDPEVGPAIAVNGVNIPGGFTNGDILANGGSITGRVSINLFADGTTDFATTGAITNAAFSGLATGFTLDNSYGFAIAARTGGAFEELWIDNLSITTIPEPSGTVLAGLACGALLLRRRRR